MINRSLLLLVLSVLLLAVNGWGATYYVDQAGGNDANPGTSTGNAWKTISKVNRSSFSAGDSILFKRGETWKEQLEGPSSGSAGNPITFGAYGSGASPVFYGAKTIVSSSWTANDPVAGIWSYTTYYRHLLYEDNVPLKHASSSSCNDGNWFHDGGKVYYKPTTGILTNHVVELDVSIGIELKNNSYITIDGITFTKSYYGVSNSPTIGQKSSYITVRNCTFSNNFNALSIRTNNAISSTIIISNNTFDYNGQSIFIGGYGPDAEKYPNNTDNVRIDNNIVKHCSEVYGAKGYDWSSAADSIDVEGIGIQNLTNSNIFNNTISGACRGIYLYASYNNKSYNNKIYHNRVETARAGILLIPFSEATSYYNNNVYYNVLLYSGALDNSYYSAAVILGNVNSPSVTYNNFYNNTICCSRNGMYVMPPNGHTGAYWRIENNIFFKQTGRHILESPSATNIVYKYNLYYPDTAKGFYVGGDKTFAQWKAVDGVRDINSPVPADPLFISATNFRLYATSPARDAGTNVGLTSDFVGNPVPFGIAPDIGAYEYIGSSKVPSPVSNPRIIIP